MNRRHLLWPIKHTSIFFLGYGKSRRMPWPCHHHAAYMVFYFATQVRYLKVHDQSHLGINHVRIK
jgi:hypothetical protein